MSLLTGNIWVRRGVVTLFTAIQHVQVMSYGNRMIEADEGHWTSKAKDLFDGMEKLALRFTGDGYLAVYILSMLFSLLGLVLYLVFLPKIHQWNRQTGLPSYCILFFEYIIFGLGFIPMMSSLSEIQYCNDDGYLKDYTSVTCWEGKQLTMLVFAFFGGSAAMLMSAVVCPILKSERKGVEMRWVDEAYFPGLMCLLDVGIINLFAAVHHAYLGISACGVMIIYLAMFQCYKDNFIASAKMAVLWGDLWVFICAQEVKLSNSRGSGMLIGWVPAMLFGYCLMWILWFLFHRKTPSKLALEK